MRKFSVMYYSPDNMTKAEVHQKALEKLGAEVFQSVELGKRFTIMVSETEHPQEGKIECRIWEVDTKEIKYGQKRETRRREKG